MKEATRDMLADIIRQRLIERFGQRKLQAVKVPEIAACIAELVGRLSIQPHYIMEASATDPSKATVHFLEPQIEIFYLGPLYPGLLPNDGGEP